MTFVCRHRWEGNGPHNRIGQAQRQDAAAFAGLEFRQRRAEGRNRISVMILSRNGEQFRLSVGGPFDEGDANAALTHIDSER